MAKNQSKIIEPFKVKAWGSRTHWNGEQTSIIFYFKDCIIVQPDVVHEEKILR